jgi:uncharacterized protein
VRGSGPDVVLRYVHEGRVSRVLPMRVVEHRADRVALFIPSGTRTMTRCDARGRPIARDLPYAERFRVPWTLGPTTWGGAHMLIFVPAGAPFGFWAIWDEEWRFENWYVNLQEPLRPTPIGFDTADNVLDIVIEPDLSDWRWKDEDELEEAVRLGRFTPAEAADVRAEGERAVAMLNAREWPFDDDRSGWRPDPAWPSPQLPADPAAYEDVARGQSPGHVPSRP